MKLLETSSNHLWLRYHLANIEFIKNLIRKKKNFELTSNISDTPIFNSIVSHFHVSFRWSWASTNNSYRSTTNAYINKHYVWLPQWELKIVPLRLKLIKKDQRHYLLAQVLAAFKHYIIQTLRAKIFAGIKFKIKKKNFVEFIFTMDRFKRSQNNLTTKMSFFLTKIHIRREGERYGVAVSKYFLACCFVSSLRSKFLSFSWFYHILRNLVLQL